MGLVDRVKNILLTPRTEWDVIAAEATPTPQLVTGYVLPLAALAAIAGFIGTALLGRMFGVSFGILYSLVMLVFSLVMAVVMVFVVGFIIEALAPSFGGQKNHAQALKVAAYAYTPVWIASLVTVIPLLGILVLLGAIYAVYLLYLALPRLMGAPQDKAAGYTAVVVIIAIVASVIIGAIGTLVTAPFTLGAAMTGSGVTIDRDSRLGKLEDFAAKMEAAGKKMEAANKGGTAEQKAAAAMDVLGTALGGGNRVDPVGIEVLKPLVPETFAGMPRASQNVEKSGIGAMMVSKAEATYRAGDKRVQLEITDTGGASGLMGLASWIGVTGEKESDAGRERTARENGRMVHERASRDGTSEYTVVIGERFIVQAEGDMDLAALKAAVNKLDLAKLEALKTAGAPK